MIRMIVSDMDGTLLNAEKKVPEANVDALVRAYKAGIAVCFASGRIDYEIDDVLGELRARGVPYHKVSQNGAFVRLSNGGTLYEASFDRETAARLLAVALPNPIVSIVSTTTGNLIREQSEASAALERRFTTSFGIRPDLLEEVRAGRITTSKLSLVGEERYLLAVQASLRAEFVNVMESYMSDRDCLDIVPSGISKGTGLGRLTEALGIGLQETACAGDAFNDCSMFEVTPYSYAMRHAHPDVKAQARHEIDSVAEMIEDVLRISEAGSKMRA